MDQLNRYLNTSRFYALTILKFFVSVVRLREFPPAAFKAALYFKFLTSAVFAYICLLGTAVRVIFSICGITFQPKWKASRQSAGVELKYQ